MADLARSLRRSLNAGPVPTGGADLLRYAGGQKALTQSLSGLDHYPTVREYPGTTRGRERLARDRKTWRSAQRRAQRLPTTERAALDAASKRRVRRDATARKRERGEAVGVRVRILAVMKIGSPGKASDVRQRWCPALASPGELIPGDVVADVLGDSGAGEVSEALVSYFLTSYFKDADADEWADMEIVEVHVWVDGTPETS